MFFLAVARYVAISRKPLHCAVGFTVIAFLLQLMQGSFLVAVGYALVTLPLVAGTYLLLDRFEDQLPQWLVVAALGGCLVGFGPDMAIGKLRSLGSSSDAATVVKPQIYVGSAFRVTYPSSWTLDDRGRNVFLRAERKQAMAVIMIRSDGKPTSRQVLEARLARGGQTTITESARLGGLPGFALHWGASLQTNVLHHQYAYALTADTLHIDALVSSTGAPGPDAQALVQEVAAIEASWKWKPDAL
ncbi:MAG: hypothetical protein JWM80_4916 [Cyanobacteria bacterium RYN_339]|nr:hypothetical protein [Cyanobacteria bacterium RYN_339]